MPPSMSAIRFKLARVTTGLLLGLGFMFMASVFVPQWSEAQPAPLAMPSTDPHAGLVSLGSLESDRYVVRVFADRAGPLFSVYDARDDTELAVLLTSEEVARRFPDLPITEMDFGSDPAHSPVMVVGPDETGW